MYNDKILDHFDNPRNVGTMENPDAVGKWGDPNCGDSVELYLKIENNIITDVKYQVKGCIGAISTTSVYSELIKGKHIEDAAEVNDVDILEALDNGLPEEKMHCSYLGGKALHAAIINYILN